ncbi:MAG: hypothetical protein ACM3KM_01460 [Acidobacteriaceae bacterium]
MDLTTITNILEKTKPQSTSELVLDEPFEPMFFTKKEKEKIENDEKKLEMTKQYHRAVVDNPDYSVNLEKAVLAGQIYSSQQAVQVNARLKALNGSGARLDLNRSIIHPDGWHIIGSETLVKNLGLASDAYIFPDQLEVLIQNLKSEGVGEADLNKVRAGMKEHAAVGLQRGVYVALKEMLEEALAVSNIKASFESYRKKLEPGASTSASAPSTPPIPPHGTSLDELKNRISTKPAVPSLSSTPPSKPAPKTPPLTPTEIKREVKTLELPAEDKPEIKPVVAAKPLATPMVKPAPVPPPRPKVGPLPGLAKLDDIVVTEDLRKIQLGHLRQGYLPEQVKIIKSKIAYLAGTNKVLPVQVSTVFQESPLFKLYLKMGRLLIEGNIPDKRATFNEVAAKLSSAGEDPLTIKEFEAVADLRKELEQM